MEENKNKTAGILVAVGFHALIVFLLFILPGFKSDIPGDGEGIEVSLGSDIEGGNSNTMADLGSDNATPPPPQEQSGDNSMDNVATDDKSESKVVVPEKDKKVLSPQKKTDAKTTTKTETKAAERKVDEKSTFKKSKTGNNNGNDGGDPNSSGYGGDKSGNRGKEYGDPNGNPDGTGGDHGNPGNYKAGVDLKGRDAKSLPSIDNNFKEEGVLRLKITVDNDGNVVEVKVASGTTITDLGQRNKAIQQIKAQLRFNKVNLTDYQSGYYTIIYKKH